jgi:peptidyl-prolyl cis-trans isomerase SurA
MISNSRIMQLALIAFMLAASPAIAQDIYTAIKVNDSIITNYDINARAKLFQLQRMSAAAAKEKAKQELIDEALQMQEAKRLNMIIAESEVDAAMGTIAQRSKLTTPRFEAALRQSGVDPQTLRERIRATLAWRNVIQAKFRATVNIREEDVVAAMADQGVGQEGENKVREYTLQQVVFILPEKASGGQKAQKLREAEALRSRFTSCTSGLELTKGLTDVVVKDLGRRTATDLPKPMVKTLDETNVGRLTQPEAGNDGVMMLAVCDKRDVTGVTEEERSIENELREEEGELLARSYIRDLRANATIIENER